MPVLSNSHLCPAKLCENLTFQCDAIRSWDLKKKKAIRVRRRDRVGPHSGIGHLIVRIPKSLSSTPWHMRIQRKGSQKEGLHHAHIWVQTATLQARRSKFVLVCGPFLCQLELTEILFASRVLLHLCPYLNLNIDESELLRYPNASCGRGKRHFLPLSNSKLCMTKHVHNKQPQMLIKCDGRYYIMHTWTKTSSSALWIRTIVCISWI